MNILRPDYIGFVIGCPSSPRSVSMEMAERLSSEVDEGIGKIGVFVDMDIDSVAGLLRSGLIDMAQLHGSEDDLYIRRIQDMTGRKVIKSFPAPRKDEALGCHADMILFDGACPGSGIGYDYSSLIGFPRPFFVAGGLSPENVADVIAILHPFAVDVSSSVESMGAKDYEKAERFIREARRIV